MYYVLKTGHRIYTITSQLCQKGKVYCSHQKERKTKDPIDIYIKAYIEAPERSVLVCTKKIEKTR